MANLFNKKKLNTHDIQSLNYLVFYFLINSKNRIYQGNIEMPKAPLNNLICNFEELKKLLDDLKENKLNIPENIYHFQCHQPNF